MDFLEFALTVGGLLGVIALLYHRYFIHPRKVSDAYMRGWQDGLSNRDFPTYSD